MADDPIQGLIDYVNEIKPFHTKILEAVVTYAQSDDLNVSFDESLEMDITLFFPAIADENNVPIRNCPEGWGFVWDRVSPFIIVDASISPQTISLDGNQSEFFIMGTRFEVREPISGVFGSPGILGSPTGTPAVPGGEISHTFYTNFGSPHTETLVGDGTWQDFNKVNVTLNTSSLNVGDDYFVFAMAAFGNTNSVTDNHLRLVEDIPGSPLTLVPFSDARMTSFVNEIYPYAFFTSFTATGNDLKFQARGSGNPVIDYPKAFAISRTDLTTNALYSEDTVGLTPIPTTNEVYTDSAASITLDDGSSDYLVFWSVQWDVNDPGRDMFVGLRFGSGSPQDIIQVSSLESQNATDQYVTSGYTVFPARMPPIGSPKQPLSTPPNDLDAGSPLVPIGSPATPVPVTVAVRMEPLFDDDNLLRAAIGAIKLSAFDSHFAKFDPNTTKDFNQNDLLSTKHVRINTDTALDWFILGSSTILSAGAARDPELLLSAALDIFGSPLGSPQAGSPNTIFGSPNFGIDRDPQVDTFGATESRAALTFNEVSSIANGSLLTTQLRTESAVLGDNSNFHTSLLGFTWNLPGTPGTPGALVGSPPPTPEVYKLETLSVSYNEDTNRTILGAKELSHDFLGSPVLLTGSPTIGSPFVEGSPPLAGNEFFFPPYPVGSISNGDVFICYNVVETNTLTIGTRPLAFYGSPPFGSPFGSPLSGSPKFDPFGSPATYPNFGSPPVAGNTIILQTHTTAPFVHGHEVVIRNANNELLNKKYNIYSSQNLGGNPNLIELVVLEPVLVDEVGSPYGTPIAELLFTPKGWSGGDLCSDIPPEWLQTYWLENLDLSWRFVGSPTNEPMISAFQHFILEADALTNTIVVEGDVRYILNEFGSPLGGSPISIPAIIQHAVSTFTFPFGSPVPLSANNGPVVINNITFDLDTNRSTIFLNTVSASTPTGWIISH